MTKPNTKIEPLREDLKRIIEEFHSNVGLFLRN